MNIFITMSAFTLGFVQLIFLFNVFWSIFKGKKAEDNPWKATTLEWIAPTPPPHGNFPEQPTVHHGPYEYSVPEAKEDWVHQTQAIAARAEQESSGKGNGSS